MRAALETVARILTSGRVGAEALDWGAVRYQHSAAVRALLAERYAPATANKTLAALRGVLKEAWRLGLVSAEDYHRAADLPGVRGQVLPAGRALAGGELRALFDACARDRSPAGRRDAAILAVLYGGGIRRAELVALDVEAFDQDTGEVTVRAGKGRKDRTTYADGAARAAVLAWLRVRGDEPGPLFCPINKGGRIALRRMTGQAVLHLLRKRAAESGVRRFSPHDLRRTFVSDLLDAGADIATVQRLAGHASVTTTQRYDRRGEVAKRKASTLLHVPFDDQRENQA